MVPVIVAGVSVVVVIVAVVKKAVPVIVAVDDDACGGDDGGGGGGRSSSSADHQCPGIGLASPTLESRRISFPRVTPPQSPETPRPRGRPGTSGGWP